MRAGVIMGLLALATHVACATPSINSAPFDPERHKLVPGDSVAIAVSGEPSLRGRFLVNEAGEIDYPLVGALPARCNTTRELADRLRNQFATYLRQPTIEVSISAYAPYRVEGAVTRPGEYPFTPGLTVAQAIVAAGGPVHGAERARLRVKHVCAASEMGLTIESSTPVNPGDRLRAARRRSR